MHWREIARRQFGVISRAQLRGAGRSDSAVTRLVTAGALERVHPGVFLVGGAPFVPRAELHAAALACGGAVGFASAAHVWGHEESPPDRVHLTIDPARRPRTPAHTRLHRVFVPASALMRHEGLLITSPTWSLLDHLGTMPARRATRLADRALQRQWLSPDDLERRLRDHPGRAGNRQLRHLLDCSRDGAAAQSERILHRLLRDARLSGWTANLRVSAGGRVVAVVDVGFRARRLAIEVDGWAFHSDVDRFRGDRRRQNLLTGLGWTVLRFTWADLTEKPDDVIATIVEFLAR